MPWDDFSTLDPILGALDKQKDRLGVYYKPLYMISGSLVFILFLFVLIGVPIMILGSETFVVAAQVLLLAAYFMMLQSIKQNVFDRFVFAVGMFAVVAAAPVFIHAGLMIEGFLELVSPSEFKISMRDLYAYSLVRGLGTTVWAAPLLVLFVFFPSIAADGEEAIKNRLNLTLLVGLVAQVGASTILIWREDIFGRANATTEGAKLAKDIGALQTDYMAWSLAFIASAFLALLLAKLFTKGEGKRLLAVVATCLFVTQALYLTAKTYSGELRRYYPAARSVGVKVYQLVESQSPNKIVFTHTLFDNLGDKYNHLQPYSWCKNPQSGKFTYQVRDKAEFLNAATELDRLHVPAESFFCQTPSE